MYNYNNIVYILQRSLLSRRCRCNPPIIGATRTAMNAITVTTMIATNM